MRLSTRKLLDHSFTGLGFTSIALMTLALLVLLAPIFKRGAEAFIFRGTIEHRRFLLEKLERGNRDKVEAEIQKAHEARAPVFAYINGFMEEMNKELVEIEKALEDRDAYSSEERRELRAKRREIRNNQDEKADALEELREEIADLLGPEIGAIPSVVMRKQYGTTRWDRTHAALEEILFIKEFDHSNSAAMGKLVMKPRVEKFKGTSIEPMFKYLEDNLEEMMRPRLTFYWGFFTDIGYDAHIFGGIWPALLGTIYLTLGAMLFATPFGVIAAIYFVEYAGNGRFVSFLRICVSTLAGVPSIVFGLFGLAFLINTIHVSESKSVLAGSITLALLILPTIIRASEEAIRSVPKTYREASLGLGASKWRTIVTVILPAAASGILTGTIISMGRAAGETAPIIFTAAVSQGDPLKITEIFTRDTPALPWNIYNLCTEHEAIDEIRHVQYGMVLTLILLVLALNLTAIILRARINKKLRG